MISRKHTKEFYSPRPVRWILCWFLCFLFIPLFLSLSSLSAVLHSKQPSSTESTETVPPAEETNPEREKTFLSQIRQITYEGLRAGEGYFSADGKQLIFQSEREPNNPFYQIYHLNLETGDTRRLSSGIGKTTCAWLLPDGQHYLYASTHLDPESTEKQKAEFEERLNNRIRKYSWDYDESYEIFKAPLDGSSEPVNLTQAPGYDAEGAASPDGKWMVFASNRHVYTAPSRYSPEDLERLKVDKAYFMDLYLTNLESGETIRLTKAPGYDGGPFFSADGESICWRRFNEKGDQAEIWIMDRNGKNQRQLTQLEALSWAPYFHPSGQYLIFATNLHGFGNFELYLVDAKGEKKPVRVTYTDGFDSLPVFSPDGKTLSWTSNRNEAKQSQIYMAEWNHQAALDALGIKDEPSSPQKLTEPSTPIQHPQTAPSAEEFDPDVLVKDLELHLKWLASDVMQGRRTGTEGEKLATEYVAQYLNHLGFKPAGDEGSYFQKFTFTSGVSLGEKNKLTLSIDKKEENPSQAQWIPLSFSKLGQVPLSDIVWAGYGIDIPESESKSLGLEPYSSYVHLDVKDKWVMMLRYLPESLDSEKRSKILHHSGLRHKAFVAKQRGARGIIVVSGPNSKVTEQLVPLAFDSSLSDSDIAAISISDELAEKILAQVNKNLKTLQDEADTGEMQMGFAFDGIKLAASIDLNQEKKEGRNVLAYLPPISQEGEETPITSEPPPVVLGAHIDHLGTQGGSQSRAKDQEASLIHFGADDNASGMAAILEIAQKLSVDSQARSQWKRGLIIAAWSGEEMGLLGSNWYVKQMAKSLGDENQKLTGKLAAYLNLDMVGRLRQSLSLQGVGSSTIWRRLIEQRNVPIGLPLTLQNDAYLPTDATSFYLRGIPVLSAFTGAHEDYHTPSDTADKINYDGLQKITRLYLAFTDSLLKSETPPDYQEMERPKNQGTRGSLRVYLGTIPDYAQGDVEGVKLSGVSNLSPAQKAGIKTGDIIVELHGKPIKNIYDFTYVMSELKVGETTTVVIKRQSETISLDITPASRD